MNKGSIQSVGKALAILELFTLKPAWGITEISDEMKYPTSTTHRIMITLEEAGYVYQENTTKKYYLTIKPYLIGSKTEIVSQLENRGQSVIQLLAQEINESVNISIAQGIYAVTVLKANPERQFSAVPNIGDKRQVHATSVGKCLLAHNSNGCFDQLMNSKESLKAYTAKTIINRSLLVEALQEIKEQGYAVDREEVEEGLTCFGAPIFDEMNHCMAAISISVPTFRIKNEERFVGKVVETASEIASKF